MLRDWKAIVSTTVLGGFVILFYLWLVTLGLWGDFPPSTNYYDMQAAAFRHGQLALEMQPDPALLALENPYEPANRENIPVLWDATLYNGKYYLYWGPAPALLLTALKFFYIREIGDNILSFLFLAGMFMFLAMIILDIGKTYFPDVPQPMILAGVAIAGLINPLPYILIEARIYEAAIAAGQFFFIGGLYFFFSALNRPAILKFVIAGAFFTFAAGSRTILALPIGFLSLLFLVWCTKTQKEKTFPYITAFAIPLAIGFIAYAWYNFSRFGSITEFGYTYQLTGFNINASIQDTFALAYVPPNLFKTLLNPFEARQIFPFIKASLWGGPQSWYANYNPKIYYYLAEGITGLLVSSPFLIFAFLKKQRKIFWISISLTGSTLLVFFITQVFFYTTMRYLLDLVPTFTLLALIGIWNNFDRIKASRPFSILAATLWAYTILIGIVLPLSSNVKRLKEFNPELFKLISTLFK